jgi:hypothetical protein
MLAQDAALPPSPGSVSLSWLLFRALVEEEAADADQFPPGTFFCLTPDDGTDGTGIMSSFELAAVQPQDGLPRSSDDREVRGHTGGGRGMRERGQTPWCSKSHRFLRAGLH